jgi:hypothetical protein
MALLVVLMLCFAAKGDPMKCSAPGPFNHHSSSIRCRLEWQNRLFNTLLPDDVPQQAYSTSPAFVEILSDRLSTSKYCHHTKFLVALQKWR